MKINASHSENGAVASVVILIFLSSLLVLVAARSRELSTYKQTLVHIEKEQDTARKQWPIASTGLHP